MRNLQKILALVLALVMSLSLMATAGARDFTDGDQIDETFAESVDVLTGLEVFQGYPTGDFQPKGDITRAEVAAIIYRIATGDVTDSQVGIYADYNKFSDVPSDNWAAGYINYCANAEYIKGRGDGKFYPQDKVTGYEALAMILRVVGYDKNGEFTGADWQVQTAATANQRKVTKNVNAGTLGNPASRETVAELLCQAILIEKVNYTLAFGYQISTDPKETIAYETFKMEKLEGVVTGNEIADLKTDKGTALGANQTRLVIDGREEVMNIPTGLDDIGECVRVYIRPENGTVRNDLVTSKVYSEGLNKVFTTSERVGSVGNTTGSSEGITSIEGAEHFINFDQADKYEARIRIRYVMQVRMSQYEAMLMYYQNGGNSALYEINNGTVSSTKIDRPGDLDNADKWDKLIRVAGGVYNYQYEKTIEAFADLTDTDYANIRSIFTSAGNNGTWTKGEVYVGTSNIANQDDVSDDIRWEDFIATYLKAEENKEQVESNGQGFLLKIIDNDNDGIAEYVLQTRYTVAKVAANGTGLDIANLKLTDSDMCNEVTASDKITVVSGTNLEASEDTVAAGDVVIYAMIDGTVRAQKAESETSRVTTINRAATPVTATIESGEKKQSAVHEHSEGLANGLTNMVIGTNYTVYYDLFGNIAAFTEGDVGGFVLITDGWFNQTAAAREYAIQAYVDGAIQTVNITNNGSLFIEDATTNNRWGALKTNFGKNSDINYGGRHIHTIVATLEGNNLVPVDKSYRYSQTVRMLDIPSNTVPGINGADANAYVTTYGVDATAYTTVDPEQASSKVYGRSDTVYYYVYKDGTKNTVTGQDNVVVRTYTGYSNIPSINSIYVEDVYAVGIRTNRNLGSTDPNFVYTADVVVVELNENYRYQNTTSEQVFIPGATLVNNSLSRVAGQGWETVTMIRGNGEVEEVTVDLYSSTGYDTVNGYDPVGGRGRIAAGLYYMDPTDTNSNVYSIRKMSNADIRANNYLTGYVDSSTILANNWVQVETMTYQGYDADRNPNTPIYSTTLGIQGKKVDTENLYTLSGRTLTKAPATTVFEQWPSIHVSNTNRNALNELYDKATDSFPAGRSNRNEVLVRYSGSNVVWAVSFAELDGSSVNSAQYVWYNNLVADDSVVTSGIKFYGQPVSAANATAANPYHVAYALASGNAIEFSDTLAATISSWNLQRYGTSEYDQTASLTEQKDNFKNGAQYKLTVSFVSGGDETYYLVLDAANTSAALSVRERDEAGNVLTASNYLDVTGSVHALILPSDDMNIVDYTKLFKVTPATANITWTFTPNNGVPFKVVSTKDANGNINGYDTANSGVIPYGTMTNGIASVTAVVTNERGDEVEKLVFAGTGTRTPVSFSIANDVILIYNGNEYRYDQSGSDNYTFTFFTGDKIQLKAAGDDYGWFYHSNTEPTNVSDPQIIAVTTADKKISNEITLTASNMGTRVHFVSKAPVINDITPETGIKSGEINTLTAPVSLGATQNITADTTINLNNNTLTIAPTTTAEAGLKVADGKTLTIEGGKLDVSNVNTAAIRADGTGKIVLKNVELTSNSRGVYAKGTSSGAVIEITGGSITSEDVGVQTHGSKDNKAVVTLNDVTITSEDDAVYMPSKNDVITINGGTLTGGTCGIEMRGGKLVMNGVTVNTTAALNNRPTPPTGGSILYGAALAVTPYKTAADGTYTVDVSATNCKFNGTMPIRVVIESESYDGVGNVINLTSCTGRTDAYISNQDIQMSNNVNQSNFSIKSGNVELAPVAPAPAAPEVGR